MSTFFILLLNFYVNNKKVKYFTLPFSNLFYYNFLYFIYFEYLLISNIFASTNPLKNLLKQFSFFISIPSFIYYFCYIIYTYNANKFSFFIRSSIFLNIHVYHSLYIYYTEYYVNLPDVYYIN